MNDEPHGPDLNTLKNLADVLPDYVKNVKSGKIKPSKPAAPKRATKVCSVCSKLYDFERVDRGKEEPLKAEPCLSCSTLLSEGNVALVCADKYAFVKSERLKDMAGQIIPITPPNFTKIEQEFNAEWNTKSKHEAQDNPGKS